MTEVEAFELAAAWSSNAKSSFTIYITFTFGFLVTAYFVANNLTRFQSVFFCALYFIAASSALISTITELQWFSVAASHAQNLAPDGIASSGEFWIWYLGVLPGLGILVSLYSFWEIRRRDGK